MTAPIEIQGNGRDARGRFVPGHPGGPGRPRRRISVYQVAERKAAETGFDIEAEVFAVVLKLIEQAKAGDVTAARLVLDRLCSPERVALDIANGIAIDVDVTAAVGPPIPNDVQLADWALKLADLLGGGSAAPGAPGGPEGELPDGRSPQ
ncbi:MAG: hypothetical protein H6816_16385 [Phycisphaerales bacterium]|nr:hypothetical protein [Phycisphaerales bacterium]